MRLVASVAAASLIADQLSKQVVVEMLDLKRIGSYDLLPPWLTFRMAWNQGVNFGLFSGETEATRWGLIVVALAITVWVALWMRKGPHSVLTRISAGLLIGGALGNVIDRIRYGAVADFLNMSLPGWQNPYSFNIADIAIFAGAFGLVLFSGNKPAAGAR
ncbi:MAG: signal peptidase II [Paracoccaceae bacterium]